MQLSPLSYIIVKQIVVLRKWGFKEEKIAGMWNKARFPHSTSWAASVKPIHIYLISRL